MDAQVRLPTCHFVPAGVITRANKHYRFHPAAKDLRQHSDQSDNDRLKNQGRGVSEGRDQLDMETRGPGDKAKKSSRVSLSPLRRVSFPALPISVSGASECK